ncbi:flagellar basal body rod protein FlgB [Acidithiobacillus sp. IBUN Pt1247-S3]|uniref:flagellar basal body rod protein FlgB n=1 Tax=Acidithiobacillus sp. IBUN Pt1247-S3 TaxID=3166642 RepID=UPI0034E48F97
MTSLLNQTLDPLADALRVSGYRQQLLAANIANADTPNYKAVDIPFAKTLQAVQAGQGMGFTMETDQTRQFTTAPGSLALASFVQYQRGSAVGLDGNSVDMNQEQSDFAQNGVRYQADVTFVTGTIKSLLSAITGITQ